VRRLTADRYIRVSAALTVVAVAMFAAIISYSHIYTVSRAHGESVLDARLLPLSVDGLILAASLTAFYASRNRLPVPALARLMLVLGIGATIAVNWLFGFTHGVLGGLLSAWPAASFIGAVELTIWMVRAAASIRPTTRRTGASERRQWARFQGYDVADRGRLPAEVAEAWEARNRASGDDTYAEAHTNGHHDGPLSLSELSE
jgi:Protein of unknown function (DUF2637)